MKYPENYSDRISDIRALDDAQKVAIREDDLILAGRLAKCRSGIIERILMKFETSHDNIESDVENLGFNPIFTPQVRTV